MRLLVVDDEDRVVELVVAAFQDHGHEVASCHLGEVGLRLALTGRYDMVILDICLPDRDGWSILTELKSHGVSTPVLMLSGLGDASDRVKGFELGADDYLPKPFDVRELVGRVRAIARRTGDHGNRLVAEDVVLDLDTRRATRAGKPLNLSPHEFLTLLLLIRQRGVVVTRKDISEQILERKHTGNSNAVEVLIRRLRLKVDDGFGRELIRTVRSQGYLFAA